MSTPYFHSWRRPRALAYGPSTSQPRMRIQLDVTLRDASNSAQGSIPLDFASAGDIKTIAPAAIRAVTPKRGAPEAETTKRAYVDFRSPDFPWRYTPTGVTTSDAGNELMRPWLMLVVEPSDAINLGTDEVTIAPERLAPYKLATSWKWAHVMAPQNESGSDLLKPGPARFSRLISPHNELKPLTSYTAMLIPAFSRSGSNSWDDAGKPADGATALRVLYSWSFTTGEGGDFETLAALLHLQSVGDTIGRAKLSFRSDTQLVGPVDVRGALSAIDQIAEPPDQQVIAKQLLETASPAQSADKVLGPPEYGRPWVAEPSTRTDGWVHRLRTDARVRVHAGTGQWIGVLAQDKLVQAAIDQAGALPHAAGLIARTDAALTVAGLHWSENLPTDPAARLAVLAPVLSRMRDAEGQSAAAALGGDESPLDAAVFTGAGQRLLGRAAREGKAGSPAELLTALAKAPTDDAAMAALEELWETMRPPDGAQRFQVLSQILNDLLENVRILRAEVPNGNLDETDAASKIGDLVHEIVHGLDCEPVAIRHNTANLASLPGWDWVARSLLVNADPQVLIYGPFQTAVLLCLLADTCGKGIYALGVEAEPTECGALIEMLRIPVPRGLRDVDLPALERIVSEALDPRGPNAPARRSLRARIQGLEVDDLAPPRFRVELDYPTWTLVKDHAPDWFLPGAEQVEKHAVLALRTNPEFIDSFLVGLNTQFLSELRWRGMYADRWGTPLQMFFAPVDPITGARRADIRPIDAWPPSSTLGSPQHLPTVADPNDPEASQRLVILINSPLFRRYPRTLVYLQKKAASPAADTQALEKAPELTLPAGADEAGWLQNRTQFAPMFTGSITAEMVFFGFDVRPSQLDGYFLVLDEPPAAEPQFRTDTDITNLTTAAQIGRELLDQPTRVAIDGRALERSGVPL